MGFTTAVAVVHELMDARKERQLLNLQRQLSSIELPIFDALGYVPVSRTGTELFCLMPPFAGSVGCFCGST